jgi:hypothetical protein
MIGWIESQNWDIEKKNKFSTPVPHPNFISNDFTDKALTHLLNEDLWKSDPLTKAWLDNCRLWSFHHQSKLYG